MQNYQTHPDFEQPVTYTAVPLPMAGDDAVAATVAMMRRYAVEDSRRPEIVQQVNTLASTGDDFVDGVFGAAKQRMYFQRDEQTGAYFDNGAVEVLVRPIDVLIGSASGEKVPADCDCHCMFVASLLLAAGIPCSFATISASDAEPDAFSHVYVVAWPGDERRTVIDASHGPCVGWEAPNKGRYREWPVMGPEVGAGSAACALAFLAVVAGVWWYTRNRPQLSGWVPQFTIFNNEGGR